MNFWLEYLEVFGLPIFIIALLIGGYVFMANLWQRRALRRRAMHADKSRHC